MMAEYRVGIIGHTGRGNYGHGLDVVWQSVDGCEVVGVADPNAKGRMEAARRLGLAQGFEDYRRMLDDVKPDIVSVCPRWLDQHATMLIDCATRGIHVFSEKPFCRNLTEADRVVEACEKHGVKLAVAFQTRYSPKLGVVSRLIQSGAIGDVLELRGRGKEDRRGGGEDLWVLGSHIFNLMHYFAGSPRWCFAEVLQDGQHAALSGVVDGNEGIGPLVGDQINAMYGFDEGVTGYFGSRRNAGPGGTGRFGLEILGSEGKIQLLTGSLPGAWLLDDVLWSPARSGASWQAISSQGPNRAEPLKDGGLAAGNRLACLDLLDAIESDRLPEANMYEARTTVEMIQAVFAAHLSGERVVLPLTDRRHPLAGRQ